VSARACAVSLALLALPSLAAAQTSLRFVNDGNSNPSMIQRVRIPIGASGQAADLHRPMDLGDPSFASGSFTIEFWMRGVAAENSVGSGCGSGSTAWISCAIVLDRDIDGAGSEFGDFGLAVCGDGAVRAGIETATGGTGVCAPAAGALDGRWHHIVWTRNHLTGSTCLFADGVQGSCSTGPTGIMSYDDRRTTTSPQDPTLVLAAEKHGYPVSGFSGWLDDARFSRLVRYASCGDGGNCFTPPSAPLAADPLTLALYRFDEAPAGAACSCAGPLAPVGSAGTCVLDATAGATNAECRFGGTAGRFGPRYSAHSPYVADPDQDGVPGRLDNCPFTANGNQSDLRGFGANSPRDGNGDACQCGDIDGDNDAGDADDLLRLRRAIADLGPGVADYTRCSVAGASWDCDLLDVVVLWRATTQRAPGISDLCDAAVP
jgi:hypothetical protein